MCTTALLKNVISSLMKMRYNAAVIREGEGEVEGIKKCLLDPRKVQYIMSSYNCYPPFTSPYSPSSSSSTTSAAASFAASFLSASHSSHSAYPSWLYSALESSVQGHSAITLEVNSFKRRKNID